MLDFRRTFEVNFFGVGVGAEVFVTISRGSGFEAGRWEWVEAPADGDRGDEFFDSLLWSEPHGDGV